MSAGAESYILNNAPIDQLAEAIRLTQAGYFYLALAIASLILEKVGMVSIKQNNLEKCRSRNKESQVEKVPLGL